MPISKYFSKVITSFDTCQIFRIKHQKIIAIWGEDGSSRNGRFSIIIRGVTWTTQLRDISFNTYIDALDLSWTQDGWFWFCFHILHWRKNWEKIITLFMGHMILNSYQLLLLHLLHLNYLNCTTAAAFLEKITATPT